MAPPERAAASAETDIASEALLQQTLASVAPGTPLREGLDRIVRGRTGALIVLGDSRAMESICSGGFTLDVPFTATGLRELAKMDGAIILDARATRILRVATQLVPDASLPTSESGTRHRTAERTARQTGHAVVSVSQSMNVVAVYAGEHRRVLESPSDMHARANQALATLERYRARLDEVAGNLAALEVENGVTLRDVALVAQRTEMVRRIADEVAGLVLELGIEGRLLSLQLEELIAGVEPAVRLLMADYAEPSPSTDGVIDDAPADALLDGLARLDANQLLDPEAVAGILTGTGHEAGRSKGSGAAESLDRPVLGRGFRLLSRVPRLPAPVRARLLRHFGGMSALLAADVADLLEVEGIGEARARAIRDSLNRIADAAGSGGISSPSTR